MVLTARPLASKIGTICLCKGRLQTRNFKHALSISISEGSKRRASSDALTISEAGLPGVALTQSNKSYPFSKAIVCSTSLTPFERKLGLMGNVNKKLIATSKNQEFHSLFKRKHPDSVRPLSVLKVELYTNPARTTTNVFTGVLMGVRRNGTETSFRLRAIVERIGVEQKFNVFSPMIKNITVIKRAGDREGVINGKPLIRRPRRNKLFYLREHPQKMPDVRKVIKAVATAREEKSAGRYQSLERL
ncbi:translation protein SH3-like domain-containing protein, partial [Phakopsora pachyrhizi]